MTGLKTPLQDISWLDHGFGTRRAAPPEGVLTARQVHGATALVVTAPWPAGQAPEADALVTATPGLAIGVLTADCVPVLLAAQDKKIVAAAHAGWRGALGGVLEAAVEAMKSLGADPAHIAAAVGPCIGARSYEVDAAFQKTFTDRDNWNARFFKDAGKPGHALFNLPGYAAHRLRAAGVGVIYDLRRDTFAEEDMFFSYRRGTLRGETEKGRQVSFISVRRV